MKITYAFIFYFLIGMIIITIMLAFLYFKALRHLIFSTLDRFKITETPAFKMIFWIVFIVIAIVLLDSIGTYVSVNNSLGDMRGYQVDNFQAIKLHQKEDYLKKYQKLREFYMAERNFMLTGSTLLVMFIFSRFVATFRKLYTLQKQYQDKIKVK